MKAPSPISSRLFPGLATWLNQLLEYVRASEVQSSPKIRVSRTTGGTLLSIKPGGGGAAATEDTYPFQVFEDPDPAQPTKSFVRVRRGRVYWHAKSPVEVYNNVDQASPRIEVPQNQTGFQIYLSINDEFTATTPTFTAAGAASTPTQTFDPARRHWQLAQCDVAPIVIPALVGVMTIRTQWNGNDIPWPPVFSFWA